jgi:hypothetical protein
LSPVTDEKSRPSLLDLIDEAANRVGRAKTSAPRR